MTYTSITLLLAETGLSAEKLAARLGISGMTLRRWSKQGRQDEALPRIYHLAVIDAVFQLVAEGLLSPTADVVGHVLQANSNLSLTAVLKNLGLTPAMLEGEKGNADQGFIDILAKIGMDEGRRNQVTGGTKRLNFFRRLSGEWKQRVDTLSAAIGAKNLTLVDKLVAYGALFYLVTPFDLIPDYIPLMGLLDDYAILSIAAGFYLKQVAVGSRGESMLPNLQPL